MDNALPQEIMTRKRPVDDEIHLQAAVRTLWRRKMVLFGSIVIVTVLSIVAVSLMTPVYTAKALVVVESRNTELADIETVISGLSVNTNIIQTEVAILHSESLADVPVDPDHVHFVRAEDQSIGDILTLRVGQQGFAETPAQHMVELGSNLQNFAFRCRR